MRWWCYGCRLQISAAFSLEFLIPAKGLQLERPELRQIEFATKRRFYRFCKTRRILTIFQQSVDDLVIEGDRVTGVVTQMGLIFSAKTVVVTAGTFLAGKIHIGMQNYSAGRAGDPPSSQSL